MDDHAGAGTDSAEPGPGVLSAAGGQRSLKESPGQQLGRAHFLDLLGDAYNGLGQHDEAISALSRAAAAFAEHDAHHAHAVCLFKIAQSHLAMGRTDQGVRYLEECLPMFRDLRLPEHEEQALRALDSTVRTGRT